MNSEYPQCEQQPQEWEEILKDVTVYRDRHEIPFDPLILPILEERYHLPDLQQISDSDESCFVLDRDLDRIRQAIDRKLRGKTKSCILLSMLTGWSHARIGTILGLSKDTVRRHLDAAVEMLKEFFRESSERSFPRFHRSRKILRAAIFPLDTNEERKKFQDFVNENIVLHLAYDTDEDFREAMVVYMIPPKRGEKPDSE